MIFNRHQPLVVGSAQGGLDTGRRIILTQKVDIAAAEGVGLHGRPELACPGDVLGGLANVVPGRTNVEGKGGAAPSVGGGGGINPLNGAIMLEEGNQRMWDGR